MLSTTTITVEQAADPSFDYHWRCDKCSFQAYVVARKKTAELLFCAHHGNKHWDALQEQGFSIFDFRSFLDLPPATLEED